MIKINILFLTIGRIDNINERGIYTDLVREFTANGHNMYVVSPIENRKYKNTFIHKKEGITFLKVKTGNLKKNNFIEKGLNTIFLEILYKKAIKKYYRDIKFDLILYSTPPITFGKVIDYVKRRDNSKAYLLLKDIFPQNAIDLQLFKQNSLIHKYFLRKEKYLYELSDYIGCMSEANMKYILDNNSIPPHKVEVNPNSIKPIAMKNVKTKSILDEYSIPKNKLKFIYGGNLGKPQCIPFLLECLKANIDNERIHFIVVGSGTDAKLVKKYYEDELNNNLTYIEHLPKEEYDQLVSIADVGMIFLDSKFTIPNFPSRILSYMENELPILTVTDRNTDIGDIVQENNFGYKSYSDDITTFNESLAKFYGEKDRVTMGENSRKYLEEEYTVTVTYETIIKHFN